MMKVGMVGVGCISGIYLKNFKEVFKEVELIAVCDLIRERAEKAKEEYLSLTFGVLGILGVKETLEDDDER